MNGYGSHTFKMVNAKEESVYCKFHYKTDQVYNLGQSYPNTHIVFKDLPLQTRFIMFKCLLYEVYR